MACCASSGGPSRGGCKALSLLAFLAAAAAPCCALGADGRARLQASLAEDDACAAAGGGEAPCAFSAAQLRGEARPSAARRATYSNPILRGSYPDPSIQRVGSDYYMVSSSFEYFPGIPIHHSKDLVNWELVGYALHRPEQVRGPVNLMDVQQDGGIQAATIRYHNGTFYVITTSVYQGINSKEGNCTNFIVTATDPRGPWSLPHVLEGADGIDSSLLFDGDRVWYTGTHSPATPDYLGEGEIWLQEVDLNTWSLIGPISYLYRGACGGVWTEGPHLYKRDGRYYLITAEGGTGYHHAVMAAVADKITGPYVSNPRNPILTTRHLSYNNWVTRVGHADFVELPDGRWYVVALGVRSDIGQRSNMGRESFLIPMVWEREPDEYQPQYLWPVVAPETGTVERNLPLPLSAAQQQPARFRDDFSGAKLGLEWNFRRLPLDGAFNLWANPGHLRLFARPETISLEQRSRPSMLGVRQIESDFAFRAQMAFKPEADGIAAGLVLWQKDDIYILYTLTREGGVWALSVLSVPRGAPPTYLGQAKLADYKGDITLEVNSTREGYQFTYSLGASSGQLVHVGQASTEALVYMGYTGAYLGLYCSSQGQRAQREEFADFDWVERVSAVRL